MNDLHFTRQRLFSGGWGEKSKFYPCVMSDGNQAVMTWYLVAQCGGDRFWGSIAAQSTDGGQTFCEPRALSIPDTLTDGIRNHVSIVSTFYNRSRNTWLIFGMMMHYTAQNECICYHGISLGDPVFAIYDPVKGDIEGEFKPVPVPLEYITACPHGQIMEFDDGDMLISYYLTLKDETVSSVMTVRYAFDGEMLTVKKAGAVLRGDGYRRGFCEPSVACINGKYYATIRTDEQGLLAESDDGYTFNVPKPWRFDDGSILESANTMQRWIRFGDCLYLVYTRRDRLNEHVFRNRAPLFLSRFDAERGCLIRDTEIILVPELGADLGNFAVCDISDREAILTTAESPMSETNAKFGSDNSIWLVRISTDFKNAFSEIRKNNQG